MRAHITLSFLVLIVFANTTFAQSTITIEVSGTFDLESEQSTTLPSGLASGESYVATFTYQPDLASADTDADPDQFDSLLDPSTTQIVATVGAQSWLLPSTDPSPFLSVRHEIQDGTTAGRFAARCEANPDAGDFPGAIPAAQGGKSRIRIVLEDADLWLDTVLPATEHLSSASQIDLGIPGSAYVEISSYRQGQRWLVADTDASVEIRIDAGPVSRESRSWSGVKSRFAGETTP